MGRSDLSSILDDCIQELQAGVKLEDILARHSKYARELRPLLETAAWTKNARYDVHVSAQAQSLSRKAFTSAKPAGHPRSAFRSFNLRLAFSFTAIILGLIFGLLGTTIASAQALPGDALYPVKLAWEEVQISLTSGAAQRLHLQDRFDQQRVTEVSKLLNLGRKSNVTFNGLLVDVNNSWNVAGINLNIPDQQASRLADLLNTVVQVTGETDGEAVIVDEITPHLVIFDGQIQQLDSNTMQVSGVNVALDQNTDINGALSLNQQVEITAKEQNDGELVAVAINNKHAAPSTAPKQIQPTSSDTPNSGKNSPPEKTPRPTEQEAPTPTGVIQPMMTGPTPGNESEGPNPGPGNNGLPSPTPTPGSSYQSASDSESQPIQAPTPTPTSMPSSDNEPTTPTSTPPLD